MDLEQLKLVLETIQSMGGDAKEFGIWWLACSVIPNVLLFVFGIVTVWAAMKTIRHITNLMNASYKIAESLGIYVLGTWTGMDTKELLQKVQELKDKGA